MRVRLRWLLLAGLGLLLLVLWTRRRVDPLPHPDTQQQQVQSQLVGGLAARDVRIEKTKVVVLGRGDDSDVELVPKATRQWQQLHPHLRIVSTLHRPLSAILTSLTQATASPDTDAVLLCSCGWEPHAAMLSQLVQRLNAFRADVVAACPSSQRGRCSVVGASAFLNATQHLLLLPNITTPRSLRPDYAPLQARTTFPDCSFVDMIPPCALVRTVFVSSRGGPPPTFDGTLDWFVGLMREQARVLFCSGVVAAAVRQPLPSAVTPCAVGGRPTAHFESWAAATTRSAGLLGSLQPPKRLPGLKSIVDEHGTVWRWSPQPVADEKNGHGDEPQRVLITTVECALVKGDNDASYQPLYESVVAQENRCASGYRWLRRRGSQSKASLTPAHVARLAGDCVNHVQGTFSVKYDRHKSQYNYHFPIKGPWLVPTPASCSLFPTPVQTRQTSASTSGSAPTQPLLAAPGTDADLLYKHGGDTDPTPVCTVAAQTRVSATQRALFFIVPVANDPHHLLRLLRKLQPVSAQDGNVRVVVVDMGQRPSLDKKQLTSDQLHGLKVDLVPLPSDKGFSRTLALLAGVKFVRQLYPRKGEDGRRAGVETGDAGWHPDDQAQADRDPLLFFIDTSILVPPSFALDVRSGIQCGHTVFAPIPFKCLNTDSLQQQLEQLNKASQQLGLITEADVAGACGDGYWVNTGYGMIGACLSDYEASGGFNSSFGYAWGGEDVDLALKLMASAVPTMVRHRVAEFLHIRPRAAGDAKYYETKNTAAELPVTPLTTVHVRNAGGAAASPVALPAAVTPIATWLGWASAGTAAVHGVSHWSTTYSATLHGSVHVVRHNYNCAATNDQPSPCTTVVTCAV